MRIIKYSIILVVFFIVSSFATQDEDEVWGFYGHKLINRTAIFTLPVDLLPLYKDNLSFIVEHSIDPDKRRHASPLEAIRHYIDIDNWGVYPFENVPRNFAAAMLTYGNLDLINSRGDTISTWQENEILTHALTDSLYSILHHEIEINRFKLLDEAYINLPVKWVGMDSTYSLVFTEGFTEFGILPYHLQSYQNRLTSAFRNHDLPLVLRLSTEMGHYISDAHVPLHTTLNYNGQLTGQDGIHAFWESRIPELFAESSYNLFTGRAKYIEDTNDFFWNIVLDSHSMVADVLSKELELRNTFSKDKQYCFDQRNDRTTRMECKEYAAAYRASLNGMVEDQMRKSIAAVGSSWYTAWVDAGRPDIAKLSKG